MMRGPVLQKRVRWQSREWPGSYAAGARPAAASQMLADRFAKTGSLRNGCPVPKNAAVRTTAPWFTPARPSLSQPARIAASRAALIERPLRPGCATDPRERARQDICVRITVGFCRGSATRGRTGGRSGGAQAVSPSAPCTLMQPRARGAAPRVSRLVWTSGNIAPSLPNLPLVQRLT
jgi:hypothetical protein